MRRSRLSGVLAVTLAVVLLGAGLPGAGRLGFGLVGSAAAAPLSSISPPCTTNADLLTPVVCLPADYDEDQAAPVGQGDSIYFAAQVVNRGVPVTNASVVIGLPATLHIAPGDPVLRVESWWMDDGGTASTLTCATSGAGSTVTCATGPLATGANILVVAQLTVDPAAPIGSKATFTVGLQSAPAEPVFPPTSVQAAIDVIGNAPLQVTIAPTSATVTVGKSATLVATIRNLGPDPAPAAFAFGVAFAPDLTDPVQHFVITNSAPLPAFGPDRSSMVIRVMTAHAAPGPVGYWPVGTIAPGASATVNMTVKALSVGRDDLDVAAGSDAADPACDNGDDQDAASCKDFADAALTAVAPVVATTTPTTTRAVTTAPTTVTTTRAAAATQAASTTVTAQLPNTGFRAQPWLLTAFALLVLGAGLVAAGDPRRRMRFKHR